MTPSVARSALVAVLLTAACTHATVSARLTLNPVLLGPVTRLGTSADGARRPVLDVVHVNQRSERSGSAFMNSDLQVTSTWASASQAAASLVDWEVLLATNGRPERVVRIESLSCRSFVLNGLFGIDDQEECTADGVVVSGASR